MRVLLLLLFLIGCAEPCPPCPINICPECPECPPQEIMTLPPGPVVICEIQHEYCRKQCDKGVVLHEGIKVRSNKYHRLECQKICDVEYDNCIGGSQ